MSDVALSLTRTEALALAKIADVGLRVTETLGLIPNTATAERALAKLNAATAGRKR